MTISMNANIIWCLHKVLYGEWGNKCIYYVYLENCFVDCNMHQIKYCSNPKRKDAWFNRIFVLHWNENVIILMKVSSLAASKVVILTTFGAASDEDFIKMMTFSFQCRSVYFVSLVSWFYCVSVITSITMHCVTINKPEWKKYWVKLTTFMSIISLLLGNKTVRIIHVASPRTNADSDVLSSKCLCGYSISMFINVLIIRGYAFLTIFLFCFVFVASYMRQWAWSTLVQVMACRLFGAEPLSNQCWIIVDRTPGNKFQWNSNRYSIIFIRLPSAKRQPFCLGLNMLILHRTYWI